MVKVQQATSKMPLKFFNIHTTSPTIQTESSVTQTESSVTQTESTVTQTESSVTQTESSVTQTERKWKRIRIMESDSDQFLYVIYNPPLYFSISCILASLFAKTYLERRVTNYKLLNASC